MHRGRGTAGPSRLTPVAADKEAAEIEECFHGSLELDVRSASAVSARHRRRIKRACDKCSASRTRCDGQLPCHRCQDYGYYCAFSREVKKRGRRAADAKPLPGYDQQDRQAHNSPESTRRDHVDPAFDRSPPGIPLALDPSLAQSGDMSNDNRGYREDFDVHDLTDGATPVPHRVPPSEESAGDASIYESFDCRNRIPRGSISTSVATSLGPRPDFSPDNLPSTCRYPFLIPVLPYIEGIIPISLACELLDIFLAEPGSSLFHGASPYILSRIFRRRSITSLVSPRATTPALIATILWCVAHTADIMLLHVPGSRSRIVNDLYSVVVALVGQRDPDRWRRVHGGLRADTDAWSPSGGIPQAMPTTATNEPTGVVDDVIMFIILSITVSGSDFKSDSQKWWSKATRLPYSLRLNREDETCAVGGQSCPNPLCSCHNVPREVTIANLEYREERRRAFWLLYSLDRHLALSFNSALSIPDSFCEVYAPLPDFVRENLESFSLEELQNRSMGPPTTATGTAFLEYYLPLMAILGDIIEVHHRREHPRLGGLDDTNSVLAVRDMLISYEASLETITSDGGGGNTQNYAFPEAHRRSSWGPTMQAPSPASSTQPERASKAQLVRAYGTHTLHVLYVLLYGKWDAICMMDDADDWITSSRFTECAKHAISASQTISNILRIDPELAFMSYLFGIYLLHGSFILLLFADRMPTLGPNKSVEEACENIIRAHEVCVVTLNTEFQKSFRKVLRSTLYSVQHSGVTDHDREQHNERRNSRRRVLSLYRCTKGARGLNL